MERFAKGLMVCVVLAAVACGAGGDEPDVPVASFGVLPASVSGRVDVDVTLADSSERLVNLTLRWGSSAGASEPATLALDGNSGLGLATSRAGSTYTLVWDSTQDVGYRRLESTYLAVDVDAGAAFGVGDLAGPFVVDNTGIEPRYALTGRVCRLATLYGSPVTDLAGKLYVVLYTAAQGYPPVGTPVVSVDLGAHDFTSTSYCAPYALADLPVGNYLVIAVLDGNENNVSLGAGFPVDEGDVTNGGGTAVQVVAADVEQDVVLNYGYP